jgi:hypothetical protein
MAFNVVPRQSEVRKINASAAGAFIVGMFVVDAVSYIDSEQKWLMQ